MLSHLIRFSIRYYGIIISLALLLLLYGVYRLSIAGLDIFPEFSPKRVIIQTEAIGFAPEQVEILISQRLEQAISGLINLQTVRSESIQGLSVITATFNENSDNYRNRQLISERLNTITAQLPPNINPVVIPLSSSSATVLTLGFTSNNNDLMALRTLVDWTIVPRLLAVSGVADVNVFGGDSKQLQIQLEPTALRRFNIGIDEISQALKQALNYYGGGFIENSNQRFTLQLTNPLRPIETLKQLRIGTKRIPLTDLARIEYAPEPPTSSAQIMGQSGIVLMVIAQHGANTLNVSRQVEQMLSDIQPLLIKTQSAIQLHPHLFRPADYIERSIYNLSKHLLLGGGFVIIILYLFLFNLRTAFISALAIPVSLISAVLILIESGISLNIMVLGGLAIALGEVVDDAIIDTENIFRRLREHGQTKNKIILADIVYHASLEVRSSVVYASFIVALVFVPLLTLEGVAGRLFAPLGYSYILAILMSLLVALTLTPALCYLLLSRERSHHEPLLIRFIQPYYQKTLLFITIHFKIVLFISSSIIILALLSFSQCRSQFLPELREGHYIVHTTSIAGTSLAESIRIGTQLTEQFKKIQGVESVSQWAGRAERGADTYGSHYSEYDVRLQPLSGQEQQHVYEQLRTILNEFIGLSFEINTFLTERIDETISGYTAPVVVNIYGNDLNQLDRQAQAIAEVMEKINGSRHIQLRSAPSTALLTIELNSAQLNFLNITSEQVINTIKMAYQTEIVGQFIENNHSVPISLTVSPELRAQTHALAELPIRNQNNVFYRLAEVANIHYTHGRYNILHENGQRRQTITCQVAERDWNDFIAELKPAIYQQVPLTENNYIEITGSAIEQAQARQQLIIHALLAGMGVLLFIYLAIGRMRQVLLTLVNIPFALVGGVLAVLLTGGVLSVGSIVGFITLFGITVRNSIMLISHYRYLIEVEQKAWELTTMIQGASERLPSILMTALVTALAMFPLIGDNAGQEIMSPMAAIIIGGLAFSTVLNLLLLPSVLLKFGQFD